MFKLNGKEINLKVHKDKKTAMFPEGVPASFPDGTPSLIVNCDDTVATIEWVYETNEEILLYYIASHLKAYHRVKELHLVMPYIPHARMDRIDEDDNETVFTLKYFCNFINSMKFDSVTVRDAHSHVSVGMLDNVVKEPVTPIIKDLIEVLFAEVKDRETIVFFPDEGASKRYARKIDYPSCFGIKSRSMEDGAIESYELRGNVPTGKFDVLICDDISSYGNTFLNAAKALKEKGAENVYLYVTHCENSILKGKLINSGLLKGIYTTDSIYTGSHELITVLGGK